MTKILIYVLSLFICNNIAFSQDIEIAKNLKKVDEFWVKQSSDLLLDQPRNMQIFKEGKLLWGEETRIVLFEKDGSVSAMKETQGRGPGETVASTYYKIYDSTRIAVLDKQQYKIVLYNILENRFTHLKDLPVSKEVRTKQFTVVNNSHFATLNDKISNFKKSYPAVSLFDREGKLIKEFGNIPPYALLQANRNGGGIVTDLEGNIYYSYLGGHKVWKINIHINEVSVFDQKPSYFDGVNPEKIDKLAGSNLQKLISSSFAVSRVSGLFFLKPNLIVQQIDDGNPLQDEEVQSYLEVWDTTGKKIASKIAIPHWIADTKDDKIYFFAETPSDMIANQDRKEAIKFFNIFKLSTINE